MTTNTIHAAERAAQGLVDRVLDLMAALRANPTIRKDMERPASLRVAMRNLAAANLTAAKALEALRSADA